MIAACVCLRLLLSFSLSKNVKEKITQFFEASRSSVNPKGVKFLIYKSMICTTDVRVSMKTKSNLNVYMQEILNFGICSDIMN